MDYVSYKYISGVVLIIPMLGAMELFPVIKEQRNMKEKIVILLLGFLVGCASNPGIVNISPDTYMITRIDKAGMFGNPASMKAMVFQDANSFAASQGKVAIPISLNEIPSAPGRFLSIEYQFRVVASDDPEYSRVSLTPRPDQVTESKNTIDINIDQSGPVAPPDEPDTYEALIRLDDLRDRGILTEDEFQSEKAKLLAK